MDMEVVGNGLDLDGDAIIEMPQKRRAPKGKPAAPVMRGAPKAGGQIFIPPLNHLVITCTIMGTSSLIVNRFGNKATQMMEDKLTGKAKAPRGQRDPALEAEDAAYLMEDGVYGIPTSAIKAAMRTAAADIPGISGAAVNRMVFIEGNDDELIPILTPEGEPALYTIRRDHVRNAGIGRTADLRWRPEWKRWKANITLKYDADLITPDQALNLLNRAGQCVGICEWRVERRGTHGTFLVAQQG